jgi:NAD(P)-dependent dehydrogenase (short-subunit alcohol dehydrogenase family)
MILKGKNVFITGGSRGLGHATVLELAKEGANIAFTYVNNEESAVKTTAEIKAINPDCKVFYYQLDVKSSKEVDRVADKAISDLGRIDVVVNNAGILRDGLVFSMSDDQWFEVVQTHLTGTFYVCRAFLQEFMINKAGKFINISSIAYTGSAGQANYAAAKAGIIGFTKSMAKEYGKKNIYSNCVVPGYFETDLTRGNATDIVKNNFIRLSNLQRQGDPSEFGKAIVMLASDYPSFINGEVIHVTGGLDNIPPVA